MQEGLVLELLYSVYHSYFAGVTKEIFSQKPLTEVQQTYKNLSAASNYTNTVLSVVTSGTNPKWAPLKDLSTSASAFSKELRKDPTRTMQQIANDIEALL